MSRPSRTNLAQVAGFLLLAVTAARADRVQSFTPPASVLGQVQFNAAVLGNPATAANLYFPGGIAVDPTNGKVFVSDTYNNRILRFSSANAVVTGAMAEAVIGQPDFTSSGHVLTPKELYHPGAIAFDGTGRLWVADTNNHRVLRFDNASAKPMFAASADGVLGQANFSSNANPSPPTAASLNGPGGVAVDAAGTVWVSDARNHRVLRFDTASSKATFSAVADGVLGQANLSSMVAVTMPTQSSLNAPRGLAVDANGTLWVADSGKNRILRFDDAASVVDGANADGVIGAPSFSIDFGGPVTQYTMKIPDGLAVDAAGNLWVADSGNNRVLRFNKAAAFSNGPLASSVLGQSDYVTATLPATPTAATLSFPTSVGVDLNGALWVGDASSARALRYDLAASKAPGAAANAVLGQSLFTTNTVPMPRPRRASPRSSASPWMPRMASGSATRPASASCITRQKRRCLQPW